MPIWPGTAGQTAGPRNRARVTRDSWSTPRAFGQRPIWPGTAGQTAGPRNRARVTWDSCSARRASDMVPNRPGYLVDPAGLRTLALVAREACSKLRSLQSGPKSPRTAGRPCGISDTGPSRPGELDDTAVPRDQPESPEKCCERKMCLGVSTSSYFLSGGKPVACGSS